LNTHFKRSVNVIPYDMSAPKALTYHNEWEALEPTLPEGALRAVKRSTVANRIGWSTTRWRHMNDASTGLQKGAHLKMQ